MDIRGKDRAKSDAHEFASKERRREMSEVTTNDLSVSYEIERKGISLQKVVGFE